jgi:hypothetical protein
MKPVHNLATLINCKQEVADHPLYCLPTCMFSHKKAVVHLKRSTILNNILPKWAWIKSPNSASSDSSTPPKFQSCSSCYSLTSIESTGAESLNMIAVSHLFHRPPRNLARSSVYKETIIVLENGNTILPPPPHPLTPLLRVIGPTIGAKVRFFG